VEPGGEYYVAYVEPTARRCIESACWCASRLRSAGGSLPRGGGAVEEERGEVKEDERSQVERKIHEEVWLSRLKPYLEKARSLLPIGAPRYRVVGVVRARVVGVEVAAGGFEELVWQEVKRSRNIMRSELAAANCVKAWLTQNGYVIKEDYASVPRPFDMVVAREVRYTWLR
jgi:hypothetical protein